ncbi:Crp/Fnr family transcriptional regulator [Burkholderiaceae bacterium UC74_6]
MPLPHCNAQNELIQSLSATAQQRLLKGCELVNLAHNEVLYATGQATALVYFPVSGSVSLIAEISGHVGLQVGMIGREGMLGEYVSLGIRESPLRAVVQGSGQAWRVPVLQFCQELPMGSSLRRSVNRCLYVRMAQLAGWSACVRFHSIGPRLACWLLMCRDRADADTFTVTHQALGRALGVRRVGVTQAAGILQRAGLISYRRGEITVLKRRDLERAACSCYLADRARYEAQF